jgi:hypothetical protein
MIDLALAIHKNVIEVAHDVNVSEIAEHGVHECLKDGRRICYAERHEEEYKGAIARPDAHLRDILALTRIW